MRPYAVGKIIIDYSYFVPLPKDGEGNQKNSRPPIRISHNPHLLSVSLAFLDANAKKTSHTK